ncbi:hypothetical protein [Streptomyces sp. NPDC058657]|uniref:hypothetical protein n=1 Tax=unclassified Streptomyces TaxID=2593676 RepID=UPI0036689FB8
MTTRIGRQRCDPAREVSGRTDGEQAEAVFDLVPVGERRPARCRRRLMARAARRGPSAYGERLTGGPGGGGFRGSMTSAWSGGADASSPCERIPRQTDLRDGVGKLQPAAGVVFAVQILLRTEAAHPQLALARMRQLTAALSMTSGENHVKVHRPRPRRWSIGRSERRTSRAADPAGPGSWVR